MRTTRSRRHRLLAWALLLLAGPACDLTAPEVPDSLLRSIREAPGVLVAVDSVRLDDRLWDLRLRSSAGLDFRARLTFPPDLLPGERVPAAVITGGIETGRRAVDLIPDTIRAAAVAPEYPPLGVTRFRDFRDPDRGEAVAREHVSRILLLGQYLLAHPGVDPERVALIGVSFGGFFAPAAAVAEPRFRNVALLYAGADVAEVFAALLEGGVPGPVVSLGSELGGLYLRTVEPLRWVGRISPRFVLLVNGLYDDRFPPEAARRLHRAVREPKEIVWLPTGHLSPKDTALVVELVDTAFSRLPILRRR